MRTDIKALWNIRPDGGLRSYPVIKTGRVWFTIKDGTAELRVDRLTLKHERHPLLRFFLTEADAKEWRDKKRFWRVLQRAAYASHPHPDVTQQDIIAACKLLRIPVPQQEVTAP